MGIFGDMYARGAKPLLRFVNLGGRIGIYEQLRVEEILMRHSNENWYIVNRGAPTPSIVLGISGKVQDLVELDLCIRDEVPLIRRFSGGIILCAYMINI